MPFFINFLLSLLLLLFGILIHLTSGPHPPTTSTQKKKKEEEEGGGIGVTSGPSWAQLFITNGRPSHAGALF